MDTDKNGTWILVGDPHPVSQTDKDVTVPRHHYLIALLLQPIPHQTRYFQGIHLFIAVRSKTPRILASMAGIHHHRIKRTGIFDIRRPQDWINQLSQIRAGKKITAIVGKDRVAENEQHPIHLYQNPGMHEVTLTITDELGCQDVVSRTVNWYPVPPLIIIEPSSFVGCPPAVISFENLSTPIDGTYDILWNFGDGGTSDEISPTYIFETPGLFDISLEITSPIGCYTSKAFDKWISIDSFPVADFDYFPKNGLSNFNSTVELTDQSKFAAGWDWQFGAFGTTFLKDPVFTFPDTGFQEVQLIITHVYGCRDTISKILDFEPLVTFFMPNAFTPNNDSKNEFFKGGGYFRGIRNFNMKIINRWGELIFESSDPSEGWNGRKNNIGKMSPNGVYVYFIEFTGPRGAPHEYKGYATLIR